MAKIRYKRNTKSYNKELFAGGLISGALGIGTTIIANEQQKQNEKRLAREQLKNTLRQRENQDRSVLDTYPVNGLADNLYQSGGRLSNEYTIPSNNSKQLASNAEKVINAGTHESGNDVDVFDDANNIAARVEDQEIILDGDKVLSERLGYADVAESISNAKGIIENVKGDKNLKTLGNREKNTLDRVLSPLDKAINNLDQANESNFAIQEANKGQLSTIEDTGDASIQLQEEIPIAQYGIDLRRDRRIIDPMTRIEAPVISSTSSLPGQLDYISPTATTTPTESGISAGEIASEVTPYLENIAGFIRRTPKPIEPVIQDAPQLDTTVDVSQELQDIKDAETATIADIEANTADSAVAQSRKAAVRSQSRKARADVISGKRNEEQVLKNQQRQIDAATEARNIGAQEDYQASLLSRDIARGEALQANIANIVGDIRQSELDKAAEARDERATMAIIAQSATSGSNYQLALSGGLDFLSDDNKRTLLQQYKTAGRNTTALEQKWNLSI